MQELISAGANIGDAIAFWIRARVFFEAAGGIGLAAFMAFFCWGLYRVAIFIGKL